MELIIKDKRYKLLEVQHEEFVVYGKAYEGIISMPYTYEAFKYKSLVFNGKFYAFKPIEE